MLVYERPDQPDWGINGDVTDDGRYVILTIWLGTDRRNRVYYLDLQDGTKPRVQGKVVQGMGLRRINHVVERPDTPETRGMILKVRHLVEVTAATPEGA